MAAKRTPCQTYTLPTCKPVRSDSRLLAAVQTPLQEVATAPAFQTLRPGDLVWVIVGGARTDAAPISHSPAVTNTEQATAPITTAQRDGVPPAQPAARTSACASSSCAADVQLRAAEHSSTDSDDVLASINAVDELSALQLANGIVDVAFVRAGFSPAGTHSNGALVIKCMRQSMCSLFVEHTFCIETLVSLSSVRILDALPLPEDFPLSTLAPLL